MLSSQTPHIFTIPSGYSFLENLAGGLLQKVDNDPFHLSQIEIFLPTRRACLELKRTLLSQREGRCLLLPKMSPLGDLDEDEEFLRSLQDELNLKPVLSPFKRLGLLATLIEEYTKKTALPSSPLLSFKLAKSLIKLIDQAAIENISWQGLTHLVPSEFADHWQITLNFLEIITSHWPHILEAHNVMEPYSRHHHLVDLLIARWEKELPTHPIIAAGSTGTMPATSRLLQAIGNLPQGEVVLPGLDMSLKEEEIHTLSPCHPQYALTRFLEKMKLKPQDVPLWPGCAKDKNHPRATLLAQALKPSFAVETSFSEEALDKLWFIPCASPQEEALTIAILFRQHLETPDQRIVLVTSDVRLAECVKAELKRWNIEIDRSSGDSLDQTSAGVFLKLCADYAANPQDQIILLSLLKHPLFYMGKLKRDFRKEIYHFEKRILRERKTPKNSSFPPSSSANQLEIPKTLKKLFESSYVLASQPEENNKKNVSFETIFRFHYQMVQTLSTDEEGVCHLWEEPGGETIKAFLETLEKTASDFPSLSLVDYPSVLAELVGNQKVHLPSEKHPRLSILGPLEARIFHADVMILGGLNEGTWPPEITLDPWLNRPMRQNMGFPSSERRIGLSAHDFSQAFTHPKVYLTRALKVNGTPTLACRWLERLEVYLKAQGVSLPQDPHVLEWARHLDQPEKLEVPCIPLPRPPGKVRPRRLSVTQVETWMRDPYALYARSILDLTPLDPLKAQVSHADRGTLIHAALDQFFKVCPDPHHKEALDHLLFIGKTLFEPYDNDLSMQLFWKPRFYNLAKWFIETEKRLRLPGTQTFTEVRGSLTLTTPQGPFDCTAKADRIDLLPDERLRIIDYKTGISPSDQDVHLGFSPQLPLEGAIALQKGFEGITSTTIESLQFWEVKGDSKGGTVKTIPGNPHELSLKALTGLKQMILFFENEQTPYPPQPFLTKALRYNDYAHLARLQAWRDS